MVGGFSILKGRATVDLNAVRMFVKVAQAGSQSAAAMRMDIPLPTLSRRIRELERELKVQLLERTAQGAKLTDAGSRFYDDVVRYIEGLAEAEHLTRADQVRLKGRLRVSLPPVFEPWWELLAEFQREYPEVQVSVYETERKVCLIADGIDVALRVGSVVHETMVARRLLIYRHVLVASPSLLKRCGSLLTPDDLSAFPCAAWSSDANTPAMWALGEQTVAPKAMLTTNNYAHLRACVLRGEAVTELPPFLATGPILAGQLCPVLCDYPLPEQQVNLLYPAHRNPSSIVRAYLAFCTKRLSQFLAT